MKKQIKTVSLLIVAILLVSVLAGFAGNREKPIKTGIIGAVDMEVDSLKREVRNAKTTSIAGMEFCEGLLDGADVVIVKCGMGKVNAGTCAQLLINVFGAKRIINTGVAGSLDASINIGDSSRLQSKRMPLLQNLAVSVVRWRAERLHRFVTRTKYLLLSYGQSPIKRMDVFANYKAVV